LHLTQ